MATEDATQDRDPLVGLLDEFRAYRRPDTDEWRQAYTAGLIVLDTNAILDLYRLSPQARHAYLEILGKLRDRLFIPHRVAFEFHRRRVEAVRDHKANLDAILADISKNALMLRESINRLARTRTSPERLERIVRNIDPVEEFAKEIVADYDLDHRELARGNDPLLSVLVELFDGRVGLKPSDEQLQIDIKEGERRTAGKIPPGYEDGKKAEGVNGDYLWWAEVLRNPLVHTGSVMIVTNDVKADWVLEQANHKIGPRPELYQELRDLTGSSLLLTTVRDLLRFASEFLDTEQVSDATLAEASEVATASSRSSAQVAVVESVPDLVAASYLDMDVADFTRLVKVSLSRQMPEGFVSFNDLVRFTAIKTMIDAGYSVPLASHVVRRVPNSQMREAVIAFESGRGGAHLDFGDVVDVLSKSGMNSGLSFKSIMDRLTPWWVDQEHTLFFPDSLGIKE